MEDQETIVEPELAIIDPHHHLWVKQPVATAEGPVHPFSVIHQRYPRYLLDEYLEDIASGHDIRATVFVECKSMYRAAGPDRMKSLGEMEFVNGIAAMSDSGGFGTTRVASAIVGYADLMLGDEVCATLEALSAASARFRGIRHSGPYDPDADVLGHGRNRPPGLYLSDQFRRGFRHLGALGLSFDAWLVEPQLPDLIDLARSFPDQRIVLDHAGTPLGLASYAGKREVRFQIWRENIRALALSPNVVVKLGGLAMPFCGFTDLTDPCRSAQWWADRWRPYIETCIAAFGTDRCMFESNFPVDKLLCDYATVWNAFKLIVQGYSADEKADLFHRTAALTYGITNYLP